MMRATEGAVVVELFSWREDRAALIHRDSKTNYSHLSGLYEAFDLGKDPGENENLFHTDAAQTEQARAQLRAYRAVRACHGKAQITNEQRPTARLAFDEYPQAIPYRPTPPRD